MNDTEFSSLIKKLPKALFGDKIELCQWEGFRVEAGMIKGSMMFNANFKPKLNDVLLASSMKTEDVLVEENPHFLVPTVESMDYYLPHDLYTMPSPRLFHTHLPYKVLPDSIKNSDHCKIIYIARNTNDTLISMWHFFNRVVQNVFPLEKAIQSFCNGKRRPQKILFLKYEDLKVDPKKEVEKIALFLERPFDNEEDLEKIVWRCSLERLQNLEVNKSGSLFDHCSNSSFFRKGVIGDCKNYMTPEMEEQLDKLTNLKLLGSDLEL
ncbi:unnamed protein product [Withania somnifera]